MPDDPKTSSPQTPDANQQTQQPQTAQTQSSPAAPRPALFTPQDELIDTLRDCQKITRTS